LRGSPFSRLAFPRRHRTLVNGGRAAHHKEDVTIKGLFAFLLAGTLLVPHITPAIGSESAVGLSPRSLSQPEHGSSAVPLPAVPYLETMPWLRSSAPLRGPQIDILHGPKFDTLGPFLAQPVIPPGHFFSAMGGARRWSVEWIWARA
jgi:hypothetical protein